MFSCEESGDITELQHRAIYLERHSQMFRSSVQISFCYNVLALQYRVEYKIHKKIQEDKIGVQANKDDELWTVFELEASVLVSTRSFGRCQRVPTICGDAPIFVGNTAYVF